MVRADLEVRGKLRAMAKETAHVSLRVRWKVIARAKVNVGPSKFSPETKDGVGFGRTVSKSNAIVN